MRTIFFHLKTNCMAIQDPFSKSNTGFGNTGPDFGGLPSGRGVTDGSGETAEAQKIRRSLHTPLPPEIEPAEDIAFAEFSEQRSGFFEQLQALVGFGEEPSGLAKLGASKADPTGFSEGAQAGVQAQALKQAATFAGIPARLFSEIATSAVEVYSDPAFSAGFQSVEEPSTLGSVVSTGLRIAGVSPDLARAVKVGIGLAETAGEGERLGVAATRSTATDADLASSESTSDEARIKRLQELRGMEETPHTETPTTERTGARITQSTSEFVQRSTTEIATSEQGRRSLRVRRA